MLSNRHISLTHSLTQSHTHTLTHSLTPPPPPPPPPPSLYRSIFIGATSFNVTVPFLKTKTHKAKINWHSSCICAD